MEGAVYTLPSIFFDYKFAINFIIGIELAMKLH